MLTFRIYIKWLKWENLNFSEYWNWVGVWRTSSLLGGNEHWGNQDRCPNRGTKRPWSIEGKVWIENAKTPENWERSPNRERSPRLSRGRGLRRGLGELPENVRKFIYLKPCNLVYSWSENLSFRIVSDPGIWWKWEGSHFDLIQIQLSVFGNGAISGIYPGFRSRGCWLNPGGVIRSRSQPITARSGERCEIDGTGPTRAIILWG